MPFSLVGRQLQLSRPLTVVGHDEIPGKLLSLADGELLHITEVANELTGLLIATCGDRKVLVFENDLRHAIADDEVPLLRKRQTA